MVKTEVFYTAFAKFFVKKRSFSVLYKNQYGFLVIITLNSVRLAALLFLCRSVRGFCSAEFLKAVDCAFPNMIKYVRGKVQESVFFGADMPKKRLNSRQTCSPNRKGGYFMHRIIIDRTHELHVHNESFSVYVSGLRLFRFYVKNRMPTADSDDLGERVGLVEKSEAKAVWHGIGGAFDKKEYTVRVVDRGVVFTTKVFGSGVPDRIEYFRGGEGSIGSHFAASGYMLPNCQRDNKMSAVKLTDDVPAVIEPLRACPPPLVFPFCNDYNDDWCGLGVTTRAGNHNFQRLFFNAPKNGWKENGCWFTLPLGGYTEVKGEWKAPTMWCGFAPDAMSVFSMYSEWCRSHYGFKKNFSAEDAPVWWSKPIFCGWGEQCAVRDREGGREAGDYADEAHYEAFCKKLDELGLNPGTVIIDDKWQEQYGTLVPDKSKWSDLRAFAERRHAEGRRVLLWLRCWNAEGLPDDECIFLNGERFSADPTNPKYLARLKKAIHTLLSPDEGCFNCDGFKVDFMDNHPREGGAVTYEKGVAGLELMHRLFGAIYVYAKEAKPDALINSSTMHPYLSEFCDQFRIHDYTPEMRNPLSSMRYRTALAKAVMPGILVDTDGFSAKTAYEQLRIFETAAEIGVPDMYFFPEFFTDREWNVMREIFKR